MRLPVSPTNLMWQPMHLINMKKVILFTLSIFLFGKLPLAQIGLINIGSTSIGYDSLFVPTIGKAATPKCPLPGPCETGCAVYTFIGSGNWNIEGNWEGGIIPPIVLSGCTQIIINPAGTEECLLNIPLQIIPLGGSITIMAGKKFRIPGHLLRQ